MDRDTRSKLLWGLLGVALIGGGIGLMAWVNRTAAELKATGPSAPPTFQVGTPPYWLHEYVQADFQGDRLEKANWPRLKQMVIWPTEANWDSAYVIRSFRLQSGPVTPKEATVEVTYETLGELNVHEFTYTPSPSRQTVPYALVPGQERWLIGVPILKPHVGPDAAVAYLERMKVHNPKRQAAIQAAIDGIRADAKKAIVP